MSETVKVRGESRELTTSEVAGLARVSVAINADRTSRYLAGLARVHPSLLAKVHTLKFPREAVMPVEAKKGRTHDIITSAERMVFKVSSRKPIPNVWIDTKFSNDGSELIASVDGLKRSSELVLDNIRILEAKDQIDSEHAARIKRVLPPQFLSIIVFNQSDPEELKEAVKHTNSHFVPIGMVSSSKQRPETNERYGIDHKAITASMATMAMDAGITHISAAASDAELIRDALSSHDRYDELSIFGTGAVLALDDVGEHDSTVTVERVRSAVDVFVLGQSVLFHAEPDVHLLEYARAIGS